MYGNPIHKTMVEKEGEMAWPKFVKDKLPSLRKLDGITMVEWNQKMNSGNAAQLKEVFQKMDTDSSGTISLSELKDAMKDDEIQKYLQISAQKVQEAFDQMDEVGSGEVTWEQFEKYFQV